ncbi:Acetyl-CoA carboxylase [Trinorchestia longiramus]|nr:Acetyl-CoA carboxylase [Trinorchestia longiramus]
MVTPLEGITTAADAEQTLIMNRSKCLLALRSSSLCKAWNNFRTGSPCYSVAASTMKPFPMLPDSLDTQLPEMKAAAEVAQKHLAKLAQLREQVLMGGGEKAQASYARKKILPYDRINRILDDPSEDVIRIGTFTGLGMPYGDVPSAGLVCCIGKVHNRYCMIVSSEGTFKGGTTFPISVTKHISILNQVEKCGLPFIFFIDSGGAFLPLQAAIFPDKMGGGKVFNLESVLGSKGIPSMAVICGSCTAGGAYGPTLCQESVIVNQTGTVFLGGPPLVKAALGYDIGPQELGGADLHSRVSGVTDYFAVDEEDSFAMIRDAVATTNYSKDVLDCPVGDEPLYPASDLDCLCGLTSLTKDQVLGVISRITDGSRFRQFKAKYGRNLITGYAAVQGRLVGIVANFGSLTCEDGLKGSHFLQICQLRDLPVVFLQNSALDRSCKLDAADATAALRGRATMATTLACLTPPKIVFNMAGCCLDDSLTMCGPSFDPWFSFSWPSGFLHYDHNNFSPDVVLEEITRHSDAPSNNSSHKGTAEGPKSSSEGGKKGKSSVLKPGSCWYDAAHMLTDEVIAPSLTRKVLAKCLDVCTQKLKFESVAPPVYRL